LFSALTSLGSSLFLWLWLAIALFTWWATRKSRTSRVWTFIFLLFLWFLGTRPVADAVLSPLENCFTAPDITSLENQNLRQVVVLTGGGYPTRGELLASAFPHASVYRFIGGLELSSRLGSNCRLIFSGSAGRRNREITTAITMQELALLVAPGLEVSAEARSGSTAEHPENVKLLLDDRPFVLLTSAIHMPRAMRTFKRAGLDPIAYPVDFLAVEGDYGLMSFIPSVENLWKLNVALREYMALAFYTLAGW
jgi:uncharacterized SAM-binding protein YcdF (DUF218 family)